jgi:hypothetical protein
VFAKKTWIWILVGVAGTGILLLLVVAGAGVYFVSRHVSTKATSATDAFQEFDKARASFTDQRPLIEVDNLDTPRVPRPTTSWPTSATRPETMVVLVWDPNEEKIVQVALPFWLLKLGRRKIDVIDPHAGFDLNRLNLDIHELERIGPALVLDLRGPQGERVLVWTK